MEMIYDEKTGNDHLSIMKCASGLENCVTSSESTSETVSIHAVDITTPEGSSITVCDTPGFADNRGVEIDISNGIGIINAVRGARSVRPLFLFSSNQAGERMDGVVSILQMSVEMMSPIEDHTPTFNYWFTKFDAKKFKGNNRLFRKVENKYQSLLETKKGDTKLLTVMDDMVNKLKGKEDHAAVVLDPEDDDRSVLLKELLLTPAIENPEEVNLFSLIFSNFTSFLN